MHNALHHWGGSVVAGFQWGPNIEILRGWTHPSFDKRGLAPVVPLLATPLRLHHLEDSSLPELRLLQLMMHEVNPYVSFFRQGIEVMREQGHNDVRMVIRFEGTTDSRLHYKPTAPEVAVIMPGVGYGGSSQ